MRVEILKYNLCSKLWKLCWTFYFYWICNSFFSTTTFKMFLFLTVFWKRKPNHPLTPPQSLIHLNITLSQSFLYYILPSFTFTLHFVSFTFTVIALGFFLNLYMHLAWSTFLIPVLSMQHLVFYTFFFKFKIKNTLHISVEIHVHVKQFSHLIWGNI